MLVLFTRHCSQLDSWLSRLNSTTDDVDSEHDFYDLVEDVKILKLSFFKMLHPSIQERLQKTGIKVSINKFVGFDTEYESVCQQTFKNRLLSTQLAANTNMKVKIPLINESPLELSDFWSNTGKVRASWVTEEGDTDPDRDSSLYSEECLSFINREISDYRKENFWDTDSFLKRMSELALNEKQGVLVSPSLVTYTTEKTPVESSIKYETDFDTKQLFSDVDELHYDSNYQELKSIALFLKKTSGLEEVLSPKLDLRLKKCGSRSSSRFFYSVTPTKKISVSIKRTIYLCAHESTADLSMLSDFETFKKSLDIINRSYITRGKALKRPEAWVHVRDTALLAPQGFASLASIGSIYGGQFLKRDIGNYRKEKMSVLLSEHKTLFEEYAIQDAKIPLKHVNSMEEFYNSVFKEGVPLTLSTVAKSYVLKEWKSVKYKGYQLDKWSSLGDLTEIDPKSMRSHDGIHKHVFSFLSAYRGGRNESFMYGIEKDCAWYDYDFVSA